MPPGLVSISAHPAIVEAEMILRICLVATLALSAGEASARERFSFRKQPCPQPTKTCPVAPSPSISVEPATVEKTFAVNFDRAEWSAVLKWFSKETKLFRLDDALIPGTLTLKSEGRYTLPDLIDLLNEALAQKDWILIRREHSFLLHPAGEKVPPEILSQISIDELSKRGLSEFVQVVIRLQSVMASDVVPQARKLLSVFGEATAFGTNQIIVRDQAKNIRNILVFIPVSGRPIVVTLWKNYAVPEGEAEALAKKIHASPEFRGHDVKTVIVGGSNLMIYATPEDHLAIDLFLNGAKPTLAFVFVPFPMVVECPRSPQPARGQLIRNLLRRAR